MVVDWSCASRGGGTRGLPAPVQNFGQRAVGRFLWFVKRRRGAGGVRGGLHRGGAVGAAPFGGGEQLGGAVVEGARPGRNGWDGRERG